MDGDSGFGHGGVPPSFRTMDQFVTIPRHSTLAQPRMAVGGVNTLDLTSAIEHELRRGNTQQPNWAPWNQQQQELQLQLCGSFKSLKDDNAYGSHHLLDHAPQQVIPHYIPRFDEALDPALQPQSRCPAFNPDADTLGSVSPYHSGTRSANGLLPSHPAHQVLETGARTVDSLQSCSPWIERMMQANVTPTPSLVNLLSLSTSLQKTAQGDVSCVLSQTVDSSDRRSGQTKRSVFSSDQGQHESTVELSADLPTDDEELETRPMDIKRKKRMLSNRASAQRSRQRRQERLDQLEVLTAKLRVENSTLQKKLSSVMQVAKKFDDQNKDLLKKVDRLSKELEGRKARKVSNDCASSQQTACASSCEMVGERRGVDPNAMRDDTRNDSTTPSMTPSSLGWAEIDSPVRKACRMERKRAHEEFASPSQPRPPSPSIPLWLEDGPASCLESDRWLEFSECFL